MRGNGYSSEQIQLMREWIDDCTWAEEPFFDVDDLTDEEVIAGIKRHYDGGLRQFFIDGYEPAYKEGIISE